MRSWISDGNTALTLMTLFQSTSARRVRPLGGDAIPQSVGQSLDERPIDIHDIDILGARAVGAEYDEVPVRAEEGVFVIALVLREPLDPRPVGVHEEDVEDVV